MRKSTRLLIWELVAVFWVCFAGSCLHFAFELSEFWKPMAFFAAVNESVWEHLKMYFWPGLLFTLIQYTYTRDIANNYWLGKVVALAVTPLTITLMYHGYMSYISATAGQVSVGQILMIMFLGVLTGQLCSWRILLSEPFDWVRRRYVGAGYASLLLSFSLFTYFPPKVFLFENYRCYKYTGEYGILDDYEPYRIFRQPDEAAMEGDSIWYCNSRAGSPMSAVTG